MHWMILNYLPYYDLEHALGYTYRYWTPWILALGFFLLQLLTKIPMMILLIYYILWSLHQVLLYQLILYWKDYFKSYVRMTMWVNKFVFSGNLGCIFSILDILCGLAYELICERLTHMFTHSRGQKAIGMPEHTLYTHYLYRMYRNCLYSFIFEWYLQNNS